MTRPERLCPEWFPDEPMTLKELGDLVSRLKIRYGTDALIRLDAGPNIIDAFITPTKPVRGDPDDAPDGP